MTNQKLDHTLLGLEELGSEALKRVRSHFMVASIVGVIVGAILLIWPDKSLAFTVTVMTVLLSIFFLILGGVRVIIGVTAPAISGWLRVLFILIGILLVVCGVVGLGNLAVTEVVYTIFAVTMLAVGWIVEGITALVESGRSPSRGWSICYGIISIVAGLSLIFAPLSGALSLVWVAGFFLVLGGIAGVFRAVQLKKLASA